MLTRQRCIRVAQIVHRGAVVPGAVIAIISFVEHNKIISYHFGGKLFVSFFVLPAAGAQSSFNINQASFV